MISQKNKKEKTILFFDPEEDFGFLSNSFMKDFNVSEEEENDHPIIYKSVEYFIQASKFPDNPELQEKIRNAKTAKQAKILGNNNSSLIRKDWSKVREQLMSEALIYKFNDNELQLKLLETGDSTLIYNDPTDSFWGIGSTTSYEKKNLNQKKGNNKLGNLLEDIRTKIREMVEEEQSYSPKDEIKEEEEQDDTIIFSDDPSLTPESFFLSNNYISEFEADVDEIGESKHILKFNSVQTFIQVKKFIYPKASKKSIEYGKLISNMSNPKDAIILGELKKVSNEKYCNNLNKTIDRYKMIGVRIRPDWSQLVTNIIEKGVRYKFAQNKKLKEKLRNTEEKQLIYLNEKDQEWGVSNDNEGENKLGILLMNIRDKVETELNKKEKTEEEEYPDSYYDILNKIRVTEEEIQEEEVVDKTTKFFVYCLKGGKKININFLNKKKPLFIQRYLYALQPTARGNTKEAEVLLFQQKNRTYIKRLYICYEINEQMRMYIELNESTKFPLMIISTTIDDEKAFESFAKLYL